MKKTSPRRGRERRGSERADARLSMRLEAEAAGAARIVTESQNISASGVYCLSSHHLPPLSKVQITIVLPRTPGATVLGQELVKCDGIVVRCEQRGSDKAETPYHLACMFTSLGPDLRSRIEDFVTWRNLQALRAALAPAPKAAMRAPGPRSKPKPAARGRAPAGKSTAKRPSKGGTPVTKGAAKKVATPSRTRLRAPAAGSPPRTARKVAAKAAPAGGKRSAGRARR